MNNIRYNILNKISEFPDLNNLNWNSFRDPETISWSINLLSWLLLNSIIMGLILFILKKLNRRDKLKSMITLSNKVSLFLIISSMLIAELIVLQITDNWLVVFFLFLISISLTIRLFLYCFYSGQLTYFKSLIYRPPVTIIIPCYNEQSSIASTIDSCFKVNYPKELINIILINDCSTDDTSLVLTAMQLKYRNLQVISFTENQGKRHAMYAGIQKANTEILVMLDSDTTLDYNFLSEIVKPLSKKYIGGVVGNVIGKRGNLLQNLQRSCYFNSFSIFKASESVLDQVSCMSGAGSAYKKSVILKDLDKWKDEQFLGKAINYSDDRDLTMIVLENNFSTVFMESAIVSTNLPKKLNGFLKQQLRWKKGWLISDLRKLFVYPKHNFIGAMLLFWPTFIENILMPFMVIYTVVPAIMYNSFPIFWLVIIVLYTFLIYLIYNMRTTVDQSKIEPIRLLDFLLWPVVSIVFLSTMLITAIITIQNRSWGTR
jgi:hyaluronan synthase